jgi:hypothetical protein
MYTVFPGGCHDVWFVHSMALWAARSLARSIG